MKITAVKGKSSLIVLKWGSAPFALELTKRGLAVIPSGFSVEVKSDGHVWIGEILVHNEDPHYRFYMKGNKLNTQSEWRDNPTAAYKEACARINTGKVSKGANGRLIIGITYERLQNEIRTRFPEVDFEALKRAALARGKPIQFPLESEKKKKVKKRKRETKERNDSHPNLARIPSSEIMENSSTSTFCSFNKFPKLMFQPLQPMDLNALQYRLSPNIPYFGSFFQDINNKELSTENYPISTSSSSSYAQENFVFTDRKTSSSCTRETVEFQNSSDDAVQLLLSLRSRMT